MASLPIIFSIIFNGDAAGYSASLILIFTLIAALEDYDEVIFATSIKWS